MKGYQLTFFTQQDRKHGHQTLCEWLLQSARTMGIRGATLTSAIEGFGHDHRVHSAHFFDLADQPVEVTMVVTADEAEKMFDLLRQESVKVFYAKTPVEFGMTGD